MTLLGCSGAPRWYQGDEGQLDRYIALLKQSGATAIEVVLHHGPADDRTARVHLLRQDWDRVLGAYRRAELAVQVHVSLDPRFATSRWLSEPEALRAEYKPILAVVGALAVEQGRVVLIAHGSGDSRLSESENREATVGLLGWLAEETASTSGRADIALELRAAVDGRPAVGRTRASLLDLVQEVDSPRVGICWDLAHDFENSRHEAGWTVVPDDAFLDRVVHVHAHDIDDLWEPHYPLVLGRVPVAKQLAALARRPAGLPSITMEVRWRCAERLGQPWDLLARSFESIEGILTGIEADDLAANELKIVPYVPGAEPRRSQG